MSSDDRNDMHVHGLWFADAVFGSELAEEVEKSRMEAPWAVVKCVQEIEQWCQEHSK